MLYLFLADGFEEIEALATLDILRRADIAVTTVGVMGNVATGTHDIPVTTDILIDNVDFTNLTGVILPGGLPGAINLEKNNTVIKCIEHANNNKLLVAAICAAPSILGHLGILAGKTATCFPGFENELKGAKIESVGAVKCDNIITGKGAGATFDFAFKIVEALKGSDVAKALKDNMQCTF